MADQETFPCRICGVKEKKEDLVPAERIPASIVDCIIRECPEWSPEGFICQTDLDRFMIQYARDVVDQERAGYASLEGTINGDIRVEDHLPKNDNVEYEKAMTLGERVSDSLAGFAGSWTFILVFAGLLVLWIVLNSYILLARPFDPYPYILLNLVLSIIAAVQAPVIIMSQNRQEVRDRLHAERDFQVSIHTDAEIHRLHKKIDYLMTDQGQKILEIQNIQLELIEELIKKTS
jgi:uncharacterized membrane protein